MIEAFMAAYAQMLRCLSGWADSHWFPAAHPRLTRLTHQISSAWLTLFTRCEISPVLSVRSTSWTPWPSWISVTWAQQISAPLRSFMTQLIISSQSQVNSLQSYWNEYFLQVYFLFIAVFIALSLHKFALTRCAELPDSLQMRIQQSQLPQLGQNLRVMAHVMGTWTF